MPYLPTISAYLEQTTLLLSACPTTTRITTKYTIIRSSALPTNPSSTANSTVPTEKSSRNHTHLTLKTYDPVSGVCLKYRTDKAAEIGRLIATLAGAARVMASMPAKAEREGEDVEMGKPGEKRTDGTKGGEDGKGKSGAGGGFGRKKKGKR